MSVTIEEVRRRIAEARQAPTIEQVRARIAQERASGVGTRSMGAPAPDERGWLERIKQGGAAVAEPVLKTIRGIQELQPDYPAMEQRRAATDEMLAEVEGVLEDAPPGTQSAGNIVGETAMMAWPASKAYRLTRAMTAGKPFVQRVAPITAESAAVGTMEGLKIPEEGQTRLGQAMQAGAANLAGAGIQAGISRAVAPRMFDRTPAARAEAQALEAAGITPDIPLAMGSEARGPTSNFLRWMQRQPLRAVPGFKKTLNRQAAKAIGDWREVMLRRTLPADVPIKMPRDRTGEAPVRDTLRDISQWYRQQYNEVLDPYTFDVMNKGPVATRVANAIAATPGEAAQRQVLDKVGDLLQQKVDSAGRLTGSAVSTIKTALRREIKLAQDGAVQQGYRDVLDALESGVEEGIRAVNPGHADRYVALREPYRNLKTVEDATRGRELAEFTPQDLFRASERKLRSEKRTGAIARGEGPLQREAERGMQVYDIDPKERESNIFQLAALGGVTGFGGAMAPGFTAAAWTPVLASMPRAGQKYMMGELPYQEALSNLLRRPGIEELSRAARIGGGQYVAD